MFFLFFSYFSLLIFYTSPRQWGLRGYLLLAKVELLRTLLAARSPAIKEAKHFCLTVTASFFQETGVLNVNHFALSI